MKKLLLVLCMIISIFSMTANANAQSSSDTEAQLKSYSENIYQSLSTFTDDEIAQYIASGDDVTIKALQSWSDIKDNLGDYVGMGEFTVEESENGVITKLVVDYSKSDMVLTVNLDKNMSVTGIVAEQVGTSNASSDYPIGALIILAAVIIAILFAYIKRNNSKTTSNITEDVEQVASAPIAVTSTSNVNLVDDFELVAVIAAAIAAATNSSTDDFVVRSIKRRTKIKR